MSKHNASSYEEVVVLIATSAVSSTTSCLILDIADRVNASKSARQRFDLIQFASMIAMLN